jgi:hypothetical protein
MTERLHPTLWRFAHHRTVDGERCLIWGNGIGEVLIPVASPGYAVALADRNWQPNALADEGEDDILQVYFRARSKRTTLYGRLYNDTPAETDTLTTLTGEVTGTGYAAVSWTVGDTDFGAPSLDGGDFKTTSTTETFTAGGAWSAATQLVLATVASGTSGLFIAWSALSATRTLALNDTLDVSVAIKLA